MSSLQKYFRKGLRGTVPVLVALCLALPSLSVQAQGTVPETYTVVDLGPDSAVWDINDKGWVCGQMLIEGINAAVLWDDEGKVVWPLQGEVPTAGNLAARGIDNDNNIVLCGTDFYSVYGDDNANPIFYRDFESKRIFNLLFPAQPSILGLSWGGKRRVWDCGGGVAVGDWQLAASGSFWGRVYWPLSPLPAGTDIVALELPVHGQGGGSNPPTDDYCQRVNETAVAAGAFDDSGHGIRRRAGVFVPGTDNPADPLHKLNGYTGFLLGGDQYQCNGLSDGPFTRIVGNGGGWGGPQFWYTADNYSWLTGPLPSPPNTNPALSSPSSIPLDINAQDVVVGLVVEKAGGKEGDPVTARWPRWNPLVDSRRNRHKGWVYDIQGTNGVEYLSAKIGDQVGKYEITQAVAVSDDGRIAANAVHYPFYPSQGGAMRTAVILLPPLPKVLPKGATLIVR